MRGNAFRPFGSDRIAVMAGEESRSGVDCFADEVVVDFPSVAPAIDRVRSGFLTSERSEALSATIQMTPREAFEGATLPLDVPVRCTCRGCGGRGESWTEPCARVPAPESNCSATNCRSRCRPASLTARGSTSR